MRLTVRNVGIGAFSAFTIALVSTLFLTSNGAKKSGDGLIGQAEAERRRSGYAGRPTPVPGRTAAPKLADSAPKIIPLVSPVAKNPQGSGTAPPASAAPYTGKPAAIQVANNPRTFVGARVRWSCFVDIVPESTFADAQCGPSVPSFAQAPLEAGQIENDPQAVAESIRQSQISLHRAVHALRNRATIVLTGPVADLEHGDTIVVDATVIPPIRGENTYGVLRWFPAAHIDRVVAVKQAVP